jgi:hypothetical protein
MKFAKARSKRYRTKAASEQAGAEHNSPHGDQGEDRSDQGRNKGVFSGGHVICIGPWRPEQPGAFPSRADGPVRIVARLGPSLRRQLK